MRNLMRKVRIIKVPSIKISTFGKTVYQYSILTVVKKNFTQFRIGTLSVKKPIIITKPTSDFEQQPPLEFVNKFLKQNSGELNLLGYRFQNIVRETWQEKIKIDSAVDRMVKNSGAKDVVIIGEEQHWEIGLLKLIDKIVNRSIHNNYTELMERGFFDKDGIPSTIYEEIEIFFNKSKNKKDIQKLGNLLNQYQLFPRYEDRFFDLMRRIKK